MRMWITMGMLLAPLLAMGDWSNSAPTSGSAPVTGPGVAAWRQHLAASGTNAHGGLIPTNAPDGVTVTYSGGVLRAVAPAAPDLIARADIAVLQTGKVDRVDTNGWEVAPHLAWLTAEADTNALERLAVETNRAMTAEALLYPRNNPSGFVDAAAVTLATGTLATALRGETSAATGVVYGATVAAIGVATQGMLKAESDPTFAAWRTNAAPGTTNAILPSGALVDISALLGNGGTADGGITQLVATADAAGVPSSLSSTRWGIGTNTTGLGGGTATLPTALTGTAYSLIYDDTNTLIVTHANPGSGPNMAGTYTMVGPNQYQGIDKTVFFDVTTFKCATQVEPYLEWEASSLIAAYTGLAGAEGTVTTAYPKLTNTFAHGSGGQNVAATHLLTTPAATIISGAARGALAVTNNQTGATLPLLGFGGQGARWIGGGKTNLLTFDGTNFISTITP